MDDTDDMFPFTANDAIVLPAPSFPDVSSHRSTGASSSESDLNAESTMTYSPLNTPHCSPVVSPNRRMVKSSVPWSSSLAEAMSTENLDQMCKNKMSVKCSLLEQLNTCSNTESACSQEMQDSMQRPSQMCLPLSGNVRPRHRRRHLFTGNELYVMELFYHISRFASESTIKSLSKILNIPPRKIKVWFQNRRARERMHGTVPWTTDEQRSISQATQVLSNRFLTIPLVQTVNTGVVISPVSVAAIHPVESQVQWSNFSSTSCGFPGYPANQTSIVTPFTAQITPYLCANYMARNLVAVVTGANAHRQDSEDMQNKLLNKPRFIRPNIK